MTDTPTPSDVLAPVDLSGFEYDSAAWRLAMLIEVIGVPEIAHLPIIQRGEIGVQVKVQIADECFRQPLLSATLDVPESHVIQPTVELASTEIVEATQ